jgi:7-keto-8-aminopelargonate synthetase and related enzymes
MVKLNASYNVVHNCRLLEREKTFANLYSLICSHGDIYAAMYIEEGERKEISFDQQAEQTDVWTNYLAETLPRNGRVAISLDTCKDWFPLFWGLVRSGHDTLLLDPSFNDEKTVSMMKSCNCDMIVCGKNRRLPQDFFQLHISCLRNLPGRLPSGQKCTPVWGHDIALCTSGTTTDSNIFVYDQETICEIALFSEKVFKENKLLIDDSLFRTLAFLPFHHVLGFAGVFIWSSFLGYITVYLKDRAPQTIVQTIKRCKVSQIVVVPLFANNITKSFNANLANQNALVRWIINALLSFSIFLQTFFPKYGHHVAERIFRAMRKKMLGTYMKSIVLGGSHADADSLKLLNALGYFTVCGFGMTETAITSFETSWNLANRLAGSIGAPMAGTQYRIKGGGNVGELQIKGPGLHDGRFVDGQLLPPLIDADGWMDTGDVIRINKAAKQYLIEGRIKDVIVNESGENVYPDELEDLFAKIEGVSQLAVLGLPRPVGRYEDIALLLNVGDHNKDDKYIDGIVQQVTQINSTLPVYKRLKRLLVTGSTLPAANGFKIKKQEVKKSIASGKLKYAELPLGGKTVSTVKPQTAAAPAEPGGSLESTIAKIRQAYADVLHISVDEIHDDSHFVEDLGGDSLQILEVVTKLEGMFNVIIPDEEYISCDSPAHAADLIHRMLFGGGSSDGGSREERLPVTDFTQSEEYKSFKQRREALLAGGEDDPYFVSHSSPLRDTCIVEGRELIDFGNYNYAGMSGRPEVNEAAKKAIDQYGTSASGSRLLAGEKPIHGELERAIAKWKHAEAAVVCVGGHSTNVTFVGNFCGKNDLILYDALAHNSVAQGCKLSSAVARSFPHNDITALEAVLERDRKFFEKVLIVIEGVYSMDGDIAPVPDFIRIKKKYGCFLMVDEAHSACVLGPTGAGVDEYFGLAGDEIDIKMGTLSKGLGTCGGYLAGKAELIEYLKYNLPGFVFSVGLSPALAAASLEAIRLLQEDPSIMRHMAENIEFFASEAHKRNLNICKGGKSAILPVLVGKDEDAFILSNEMNRRGVAVPPAVYPAVPRNKARLRFGVNSEHKKEQITYALDQLVEAAAALGITLPSSD